jgi:hypothetical protein
LFPPVGQVIGLNALNTLVLCHTGLLAFQRAGREPQAATGWRLLGLGAILSACNELWAILFQILHGAPPPFPAWGEWFSYLCLALVIAALMAFPLASTSGSERLRKGLDGLGVAVSMFFLSWFFALGPLFHRAGTSGLSRLALVVFFLANATILGIGAYLGARQPTRFRGPLGWILAAFLLSLLQVIL